MEVDLSRGSVQKLLGGGSVTNPILQVLGIKKILVGEKGTQFRLHLSDGQFSTRQVTIPTKLNPLVDSGKIDINSVIQATHYIVNKTSIGGVIIIMELDVVANGALVGGVIGSPRELTSPTENTQQEETSQCAIGGATKGPSIHVSPCSAHQPEPSIPKPSSEPIATIYGAVNQSKSDLDLQDMLGRGEITLSAPSNLGNINLANVQTIRISDINHYSGNSAIKGRVLNKSSIRNWSNAKSDGQVCSFEIHDESGAIKMSLFNECVKNFYGILQVGRTYVLSKFTVKPANRNFTTLAHPFELASKRSTQIMPCDAPGPTSLNILAADQFTRISEILTMDDDRIINVIGICVKINPIQDIHTKVGNRTVKKRDVFLADKSNAEIKLTLWAECAENFNGKTGEVLMVKRAKTASFNGKYLKMATGSSLQLGPDHPETPELVEWFENHRQNSTSSWKLIREAHVLPPNTNFKTKVTVMAISRDGAVYRSCARDYCSKKVVISEAGSYTCEKCGFVAKTFRWRLSLNVNIGDFTGSLWATFFGECGEQLLSTNADHVGQLYDQGKDEELDKLFKRPVFKNYLVTLRFKIDTYNTENVKNFTVVALEPICARDYANKLLKGLAAK